MVTLLSKILEASEDLRGFFYIKSILAALIKLSIISRMELLSFPGSFMISCKL